jgi:hypothetical protein
MSATDEEVASFFGRSAPLASRLIGSVGGAAAGLAIGGPPGAIIGALVAPFVTNSLERLTGEFMARQLGERQHIRVGAGFTLLAAAIKKRLSSGEVPREGEFSAADESGRRPIDEVTEQAILAMINAVDERRIPYLANFYAALYFDETISRTSIPTLSAIADGLNYRAMCILNLVGGASLYNSEVGDDRVPAQWSGADHIVAKEAFSLVSSSILDSKISDKGNDKEHYLLVSGYRELNPRRLILTRIGKNLFDKMWLATILSEDPSLIETEQSLKRISATADGDHGPDLSGAYQRTIDLGEF